MAIITYSFSVSAADSIINTMVTYIRTIRTGVNLTDEYLNVFTDVTNVDTDKQILLFSVDVPACPFKQLKNVQSKFLKAFLSEFYYEQKFMTIETSLQN